MGEDCYTVNVSNRLDYKSVAKDYGDYSGTVFRMQAFTVPI